MKAEKVSNPSEELKAQMIEPIKIIETVKPKAIKEVRPGVYVYDMGQNMVGWTALKVHTNEKGIKIKLRFAETIHPDGELNVANLRLAKQTDVYITKGEGMEEWQPNFTYHGFRYVEITGYPGKPDLNTIKGKVVNDDLKITGQFNCSSDIINRIYSAAYWGIRGNYRSVPTDCPQRDERHGWLADAAMTMEEACFNFDLAAFYQHFLHLIRLAQKEDGSLPDFVPPYNPSVYPADPAWGSAYISLCWQVYMFYGDREILKKHYQNLKNYIEFLRSKAVGQLLSPLGKYGDWCQPGSLVAKKTRWIWFRPGFIIMTS